MANIKLYPERRRSPKTGEIKTINVPIILSFSYEGARLMLPTGEHVDLNKWDEKKQKVKLQVSGSLEINNNLEALKERIQKLYREAKISNIPVTNEYIKNKLNNTNSTHKTIYQYFDEFMEDNINKFSLGTKKKLYSNLNHLKKFSQQTKFKLEFDALDDRFCKMYINYFFKINHVNNTIAKNIKNLKWFLNWATDKGYNKNLSFRKFKVEQYKGVIISLNSNELKALLDYRPASKSLEYVKDVFCFGCFTGLRYSDLAQLRPEHIKGDYIQIRTIKTNSDTTIPLIDITQNILDKYKNFPMQTCLPVISNQKMNDHLKVLGQLIGLDEEFTIYRYRGKDRIELKVKKYEKLSTHVARKTFISLAFRSGMPTDIIKNISTHKSDEVFSLYNNISNDHKREMMKKSFDIFV